MKKITKSLMGLIGMLFLSSSIMAITPLAQKGIINAPAKLNLKQPSKFAPLSSSVSSPISRWYNFGEAMDQYFGGNSVLNTYYLFPDSAITISFSNGTGYPPFHLLGDLLQVSSTFFNDPIAYPSTQFMHLTETSKFKVDSLRFRFFYNRLDTSITDSLIFEVGINGGNFQLPLLSAIGGGDTTTFRSMKYTYQTNRLNWTPATGGAVKRRYAIALNNQTLADTLEDGSSIIEFPTADLPIVNAGKFVASSVGFKPGYSYTPADTLNNLNHIFFISYEEQDGQDPLYTDGDFNGSHMANTTVRYNLSPPGSGNWNGNFLPNLAFTAAYAYEHHLIHYKISSLCTADYDVTVSGTPEVSTGNGTATAVVTGGTSPFSFVWTPGNITSATAIGLTAGGYTCTVTDANGCQASNTVVITGINERSAEEATFNMLPNPATNKVTIEYTAEKAVPATIRLVSINGQEVYTENFAQAKGKNIQNIDLSSLAKGVYFLQLRSENANISKKLIKN